LEIKVRGVLFDLWGTLLYNIPRLKREDYDGLARQIGQPTEEIWRKWGSYSKAALRGDIKSGEERATRILTELGAPLDLAPKLAEFEYEMRSADVHFFPGVPEMLAELRQRGYRTCLISNCNYLTPQVVEQVGLPEMLDGIVLSCLVGMVKPELEIYRLGASQIGLEPPGCLFVGDGGDGELDGARAAGCRVALVAQERGHAFRNPSKLYPYDIRLANISELLNYLKEPAEASTAA
jgi:putative hydrolase of the HAD superfamily